MKCILRLAVFATALAVASPVPRRALGEEPSAGRRLAFLVGVKEYDHSQLKGLDFPERDIDDFADVLTKSGFDKVIVLTTGRGAKDAKRKPTVENIDAQLDRLLTPKDRADGVRVTKHDTILVALAGHGIQPLGSDLAYFCPQDANPTIIAAMGTTPGKAKFPETLIAVDALLAKLDDSGVGHKLLLMDACRNDPGVRGGRRDAGGVNRVKVSALPPQTAVLLSCSPGQFAFEHKDFGGGHGAFFHHVIEGFKGAAVDAEDGGVTFDSLVRHVGRTVPKSVNAVFGKDGGEQKPNRIVNLSTDTLLLARVSAVTPLADPHEKSIVSETTGAKLTLIPAGEYQRGSPASDVDAQDEEKPQHGVKISRAFYLACTEVTQAEWAMVMGTNPSSFSKTGTNADKVGGVNTSGFPVEMVSWFDAAEYCVKLSARDGLPPYYKLANVERKDGSIGKAEVTVLGGKGYRLPTEAEWEYGARGNRTTRFPFGDSCDGKEANVDGRVPSGTTTKGPFLQRTASVGSYAQGRFGLVDICGNVSEWCEDWFDEKAYRAFASKPAVDPVDNAFANFSRVHRGGAWDSVARSARCATRGADAPDARGINIGFRIARNP